MTASPLLGQTKLQAPCSLKCGSLWFFLSLPANGANRVLFKISPPDNLLLAVVVSSLNDLRHIFQGAEAWFPGQNIGGQGLETAACCLSLLQGGEPSHVLSADQAQCVLQVAFS